MASALGIDDRAGIMQLSSGELVQQFHQRGYIRVVLAYNPSDIELASTLVGTVIWNDAC